MTTSDSAEPLGCSIAKACELVGMGRGDFYRDFLRSGLVRPVSRGKRARTIVVSELREAFARYVEQKRATAGAVAVADVKTAAAKMAAGAQRNHSSRRKQSAARA